MSNAEILRGFIVDFLRKELEGPDPDVRNRYSAVQIDGQELLNSNNPPRQRYGTAVLFPQKSHHREQEIGDQQAAQLENHEEEADDDTDDKISKIEDDETLVDADDQTEQEVSLANEYLPSAMGLSALIELPETLVVRVDSARYEQEEFTTKSDKNKPKYWARKPLTKEIEFSKARFFQMLCSDIVRQPLLV